MTKDALIDQFVNMLDGVAPSVTITREDADKNLLDIGYDSLDRSSFVLEIEEKFEVNISDEELEELTTLSEYADFVLVKLG